MGYILREIKREYISMCETCFLKDLLTINYNNYIGDASNRLTAIGRYVATIFPILSINEMMQKVDGVVEQRGFRFHKEFDTKIRLLDIFDYKYGTGVVITQEISKFVQSLFVDS